MAKSLKELLDERAGLIGENERVLNAADAEHRSLSPEERTDYDANDAAIDALSADINGARGDDARRKKQAERQADLGKTNPLPRQSNPNDIGRVKLAAEDDPKKGFRDNREFLMSILDAGRLGKLDPRLNLCKSPSQSLTAGSDEHGTYSDPYGGFFIPKGFLPETLKVDPESDPMGGLVRRVPMTAPVISINARTDKDHSSSVSGGLLVYRRAETQTVTATRMQHEQVELKATPLWGVAYASEELLARSPVSFVALLQAGFNDEFAAKLVSERISGNGAGQFEGVLNTPCLVSVTKETNQGAATINKANIDKMRTRCWRYGSAIWLANHNTLPQLLSIVQEIGTGGVVPQYFSTTADGTATLCGRPIYFTEFCPSVGTVGDILLCNWSEYLEGTLSDVQSEQSMHVRFLEHERTFKFWLENDARCWWRTALTPKNGGASWTRSPFVALQTRS